MQRPCAHAHAGRAPCNAHARPQGGDEGSHHRATRAASQLGTGAAFAAVPACPRRPKGDAVSRAAWAAGLWLPARSIPRDAGHAASPEPEQRLLAAERGHGFFPTLAATPLGNCPATRALGSHHPRRWSPFSSLLPLLCPLSPQPSTELNLLLVFIGCQK